MPNSSGAAAPSGTTHQAQSGSKEIIDVDAQENQEQTTAIAATPVTTENTSALPCALALPLPSTTASGDHALTTMKAAVDVIKEQYDVMRSIFDNRSSLFGKITEMEEKMTEINNEIAQKDASHEQALAEQTELTEKWKTQTTDWARHIT